MKLFIDCEFNEFRGELISMGIISDDGKSFYEVLPCINPKSWVKEHVMPILGKGPVSLHDFQSLLQDYLMQFDSIELIADWPDDIKLFCEALVLEGGYRLNTPPLTMHIYRNIDSSLSTLPHNAMNDARAVKESYYTNLPTNG
jgi:hypothetical protein